MRSKFAGIVMAFVMAFSFVGCSNDTPPEQSQSITDAEFASIVKEHTNAFDDAPDRAIVDVADAVCDLWDAGGTVEDQFTVVMSAGVDPRDGGFLVGAATQAYCPEYADEIEGFASNPT